MNRNYNARDNMIFGEHYKKEKYVGGIRRFTISSDVLKRLVYDGFADKMECQNYSPYIKDFLEDTNEDVELTFGGYAVSPERDDYRVTIDEVYVTIPFDKHKELAYFAERYHSADEFTVDVKDDAYKIRAWWD